MSTNAWAVSSASLASPAERSGMKLGDVIVNVNGRGVSDVNTALNAIAEVPPGKNVPVRVLRKNEELALDVTVGKRRPRARSSE